MILSSSLLLTPQNNNTHYGTAQSKLDICTRILLYLHADFCGMLASCVRRQMVEMIKQEVLHLEPVLESCGACQFPHTFSVEKLFNYSPLKLLCS